MGWNFAPRRWASSIMEKVVSLVESGAVRPVVGQVVGFEDIPTAIDAMARRRTVGRTVALVE